VHPSTKTKINCEIVRIASLTMNEQVILVCGDNREGQSGITRVGAMSKSLTPLSFNTSHNETLPVAMHSHNYEKQLFAKQPEIKHCSAGSNYTIYISRSPCFVWACGANAFSNLGVTNESSRNKDMDNTTNTLYLSSDDIIKHDTNVMTVKCVHVEAEHEFVKSVCGKYHSFIMTSNMNWLAAGDNSWGQIGLPQEIKSCTSYKKLTSRYFEIMNEQIIDIFCSPFGHQTYYLTKSLAVYVSGRSKSIGIGVIHKVYTPHRIATLDNQNVVYIACGPDHSVFLTRDGTLFGVGSNEHGRLSLPLCDHTIELPETIPFEFGSVINVACGFAHTAVINHKYEVFTCGKSDRGQCGLSHMNLSVPTFTKVQFSAPTQIQSVHCGAEFTIFHDADDSFFSCGDNSRGQLCLNHTVTWSRPMRIHDKILKKWKQKNLNPTVVCGASHVIIYAKESLQAQIANHFQNRFYLQQTTFSDLTVDCW
jgi:alpha-tubulin suppressor-like RCC1 family protein